MKVFMFAEIDLVLKCFRIHRVTARTEAAARKTLPAKGFLGSLETRSEREGRRTALIQNRADWVELCRRFDLTGEQGEAAISKTYG